MKSSFFFLVYFLLCQTSVAQKNELFNFNADRFRSNFDTRVTEYDGNVNVTIDDKKIQADHLTFKGKEGTISASGNVVFTQGPLTIKGSQVDVELKTGLGSFQNATLTIENSIYIEGKTLTRYASDQYKISYGKVSTCQDCPQSWSLVGTSLDVQIEGYAEIHHALIQIKDTPIAYFPMLLFPVKTKRQSGFLIPQVSSVPEIGLNLRIPYFWAINESSDATFEYNYMSVGGSRLITEYRQLFSDRSYISGLGSVVRNGKLNGVPDTRYGYSLGERWQLGPNFVQRFRGELASDTRYTTHFFNDFKNTRLPSLQNEASLSWQNYNLYSNGRVLFNADNIPRDSEKLPTQVGPDRGPINQLPSGGLYIPSLNILGPIMVSGGLEHANFARRGPSVDPTTNWIRSGQRSTSILRLAAPIGFSFFLYEPTLEGRADLYNFKDTNAAARSARARLVVGQKLKTEFWNVYKVDWGELLAIRHTMQPYVRYSQSGADAKMQHRFFSDPGAPRFDIFDPNSDAPQVALGTISEEQRLKPHNFITFGAGTRLVGRFGRVAPRYDEFFGANVERDYNFILSEYGRLRINAFGAYSGARLATQLALDTDDGDIDARSDGTFDSRHFAIAAFHTVAEDARAVGGSTALKAIGPWTFSTSITYDSLAARVAERAYGFEYLSPSKCWLFGFEIRQILGQKGYSRTPNFSLIYREPVKNATF